MPSFDLAKAAADIYDANPDVEGLLLLKHGHFAFGDTARQSYERIVEHTNMAAVALGLDGPTDIMARDYDAIPDAVRILLCMEALWLYWAIDGYLQAHATQTANDAALVMGR